MVESMHIYGIAAEHHRNDEVRVGPALQEGGHNIEPAYEDCQEQSSAAVLLSGRQRMGVGRKSARYVYACMYVCMY